MKRFATKRSDLIHKFLNLTGSSTRSQKHRESTEAFAAAREALNLAIIYNQRRSNAMKDKRSSYKRHLRSNDDDESNPNADSEKLPFWDAYDVVNQLYLELGRSSKLNA